MTTYNHSLNKVYELPNGVAFYELKYGDQEHTKRRFAYAEYYQKFIQFGATPDKMKYLINKGIELLNGDKPATQRIHDLGLILHIMQNQIEMVFNEDILLSIASVFYVIDGEPIDVFDLDFHYKKLELWKSNPECTLFFCKMGYERIKHLTSISQEDMMSLIRLNKTKIMPLEQILSQRIS